MDAYDNNRDGRIDIRELAQLLPLEESFKLLFKFENQVDSSVEFMRVSSTHLAQSEAIRRSNSSLTRPPKRATDLDQIRHRFERLHRCSGVA